MSGAQHIGHLNTPATSTHQRSTHASSVLRQSSLSRPFSLPLPLPLPLPLSSSSASDGAAVEATTDVGGALAMGATGIDAATVVDSTGSSGCSGAPSATIKKPTT